MTNNTGWTDIFSQINNVAHEVIKVEDELLSENIFSLFKKKDYEKYNALFDAAQIELTKIKLTMGIDFPNVDEDKLTSLNSFADALFNYIQILKLINYGLSLKATRSGEYAYRTYKKDLQSLDSARNIIADRQDAIIKIDNKKDVNVIKNKEEDGKNDLTDEERVKMYQSVKDYKDGMKAYREEKLKGIDEQYKDGKNELTDEERVKMYQSVKDYKDGKL